MTIESILRIILLVTTTLALAVGVTAASCTSSNNKGIRAGLAILVCLWCLATIAGGMALKPKIGPIVLVEGLLLAGAIAIAFIGGTAAGVSKARSNRSRISAGIALLFVSADLAAFYSLNHQLTEIAASLGITGKRVVKYEPAANKDCPENLKSLYLAFSLYVESNGSLPPAEGWMDNPELVSRVQKDEWLHCPQVSDRHDAIYGYAYNEDVAGKSLDGKKLQEMPNAHNIPLLYDSSNLARSAHDKVSSMPKEGRHGGRNNVLFCDGHIEATPTAETVTEPPGPVGR